MSEERTLIGEVTAERMADRMVWGRLATDSAYQNAVSAEAQSSREEKISAEVWAEIEAKYEIV